MLYGANQNQISTGQTGKACHLLQHLKVTQNNNKVLFLSVSDRDDKLFCSFQLENMGQSRDSRPLQWFRGEMTNRTQSRQCRRERDRLADDLDGKGHQGVSMGHMCTSFAPLTGPNIAVTAALGTTQKAACNT